MTLKLYLDRGNYASLKIIIAAGVNKANIVLENIVDGEDWRPVLDWVFWFRSVYFYRSVKIGTLLLDRFTVVRAS